LDPTNLNNTQLDFLSVAAHEFGHVLGIGTSQAWESHVSNGTFTGVNAVAAFGGPVPLDAASVFSHWVEGTLSNDQAVIMQPVIEAGERRTYTPLDLAALRDIGWQLSPLPPVVPPIPPLPPSPPPPPGPRLPTEAAQVVGITGTPGTAVLALATTGTLASIGTAQTPFPGIPGIVRAATGDFNGDGTADVVYVTGPGGGDLVRLVSGSDGADLLTAGTFNAYAGEAFTQIGLYVAAGDVDGDGRAEIVVSPDQGGGARLQVFRWGGGALTQVGNFFGIEDVAFRGGARIAVAEVDADNKADLLVGAGFGGGPRVALFSGVDLVGNIPSPRKLVGDFLIFEPGLRDGVFVAAGDLNADGRADLVFGGGPGGGPRVTALDGAQVLAGNTTSILANFFAFDANQRGGVHVAVKNLDGDARRDLVIASGDNVAPAVRTYLGSTLPPSGQGAPPLAQTFAPFSDPTLATGVFVG
jgi:hypothetical protein